MAVDNSSNIEIGKRIRLIMKENDLSYRALSESLNPDGGKPLSGTAYNTIFSVVKGKIPISSNLLNALKKTYGYSQLWVTTGTGDKKVKKNDVRKTIIDIQDFKVELESERALRIILESHVAQQEKEIAYLKRILAEVCKKLDIKI